VATKTKTYDVVAEGRKVRDQLSEELNRLSSTEERIVFLRKKLEQAREAREELCRERKAESN
jgi:hypothetical protein